MSEILLSRTAYRFPYGLFPTPAPDDGSVATANRQTFDHRMDTFSVLGCSDYVETMAVAISGPGCHPREAEVSG